MCKKTQFSLPEFSKNLPTVRGGKPHTPPLGRFAPSLWPRPPSVEKSWLRQCAYGYGSGADPGF